MFYRYDVSYKETQFEDTGKYQVKARIYIFTGKEEKGYTIQSGECKTLARCYQQIHEEIFEADYLCAECVREHLLCSVQDELFYLEDFENRPSPSDLLQCRRQQPPEPSAQSV